ncbi:MAG: 3-oxoacyl-ACP reductase [Bacteroidetes bacterium GWE2_39_28]|nr:MAG: 3-oxoacyl-ACP reductase [Bacteroidetes bacterium GWE2_39_28]OFY13066.1 MAG: 3-oxoacyl-ACP reductase [Bacteroidetes bacterium GWF2_39_10]OFZ09132.1 MAG: 3-oxoacyl-ACP reductase [Bacteroidetes bacterium RIFOXYB2_FULL_39_7]HCT94567.1 3-oxoacyl-ACP reductase [Rikenellaceae bacterium]
MYNPYTLIGKTILVTGASSGIGKAVSIECSKLGAKVVITGRDKNRLNSTFEQLEGNGHSIITADLNEYNEIEKIVDHCPQLDGFVSNAGITKVLFVKSIKQDILNDIFNTNTLAPILLTQLLVKKNVLKEKSSIVFTSSLSGIYCVHYGESMYAASKGAIGGFAKGAALDLSRKQIRVNSVNPGIIMTNIFSDVLTIEELEEKRKYFPLKRFGQPNDVAFAIIYFLSDASSWVTGAELKIDGGYTLI